MTLAQMESRFFELKGKLAVGHISEEEFKRELENLRFQDDRGHWWMIGAQSGRWYYYDGARWQPGQPPVEEQNPPLSEPEPEPPALVQSTPPKSETPQPEPRTNPAQEPLAAPQPLADRVRAEIAHPQMPQVHTRPLRSPSLLQRLPPGIMLGGTLLLGIVLVVVLIVAMDNLVPASPIRAFLGRAFSNPGTATPPPEPAGTPTANADVERMLQVADDLALKSQFGPALAGYQNAAKLAPNNSEVYTHWARALSLSGRIGEAVSTARRASQIDPTSADAFAELSRAQAWSGQSDDAVKSGEKAVQVDSANATAHAFLAEAYLRAGRADDAQKEADSATKLDDQNVDAHRAAGWIAVLARQQSQAIAEWNRVVDLAPNVFFYHYEFGQVYGSYLGDLPNAASEYQKAIALFGPYVPSYIALGRVYLAQGQAAPAVLQFQKALTFDGRSIEALVGLGLAFQKQGRCEQAIPYFQQSLSLDPKSSDALRGMAECGGQAQGPAPQPTTPTAMSAVPTAVVQGTPVPLGKGTPTGQAASPSGTPTAQAAANTGRIAFSVFDGQYHLYVAKADGSGRTLVVDSASQPAFSPDGSQLLYYSWQSDQRGIHRIEADGSADEKVSLRLEDNLPAWAPDGTQFVYATRAGPGSDMSKRSYHLRIADPTTAMPTDPPDYAVGQYPAWGPGGKIVYRDCGLTTQGCGLAVEDPEGKSKKALTNINSTAPSWSPDGKLVVFTSDYGGNWDIYIVSTNGGSPSRLTTSTGEDGLATFSPDGKQIAFVTNRDGSWAIWAMGIDGSNQRKLFDLGGELAGNVAGNPAAQPGQVWYEQKISWH